MISKKNNSSTSSPKKYVRPFPSNVIHAIKKFFGLALPDKFLVDNRATFELAFIIEGRSFYWCPDPSEAPAGRSLAALHINDEIKMRVSKEYLDRHCEEVDEILNKPRPSISDLARLQKLHKNLKERAQLMILPEFIYKLASVVFLEQGESPHTYNYQTNAEKIQLFKRVPDSLNFFLSTPLKNLIPSLALPRGDSRKYLRVIEEVDRLHWETLLNQSFSETSTPSAPRSEQ